MTISQAANSAATAVVTLGAARTMNGAMFELFALLLMAQVALIGLLRAAIFNPTLVEKRYTGPALVPTQATLRVAAFLLACMLAISYGLTRSLVLSFAAAAATAVVAAYDTRRYLLLAASASGRLPVADGVRLALAFFPIAPNFPHMDAVTMLVVWSVMGSLPLLLLISRPLGLTLRGSDSTWRAQSRAQALEYVIAQSVLVAPTLFVGIVAPSSGLAALRLVQTLSGPLNLLFSAFNLRQMTEVAGFSPDDVRETQHVSRRARWYAIRLCALAASLVVVQLTAAPIISWIVPSLRIEAYIVAVGANGAYMLGAAVAGPYIVALRALKQARIALWCRIGLVVSTLALFGLALWVLSPLAALLVSTVASGVLYPLWFVIPLLRLRRHHERTGTPGAAD